MDAATIDAETATATPETALEAAAPVVLLARGGAILLLLALLTGGYVAAAMTGQLAVDPHTALAAHIGALLGAFWMFGLAFCLPMLRYRARTRLWMARGLALAAFGNWFFTAAKAAFHVAGISSGGSPANNAFFIVLNVAVVAPSLVVAVAWAFGFKPLAQIARERG